MLVELTSEVIIRDSTFLAGSASYDSADTVGGDRVETQGILVVSGGTAIDWGTCAPGWTPGAAGSNVPVGDPATGEPTAASVSSFSTVEVIVLPLEKPPNPSPAPPWGANDPSPAPLPMPPLAPNPAVGGAR